MEQTILKEIDSLYLLHDTRQRDIQKKATELFDKLIELEKQSKKINEYLLTKTLDLIKDVPGKYDKIEMETNLQIKHESTYTFEIAQLIE